MFSGHFGRLIPVGIEHRARIPNLIERHQRRLLGEKSVCRLRLTGLAFRLDAIISD